MGPLSKFVAASAPCQPLLPLTHVCDAYAFRKILETEELKTSPCSVFGESLLYLFYGRPAYRLSADGSATSNMAYMPICLLFKPDIALPVKRLAPFDTGAFSKGFFADYMHRKMPIEDFLLQTSTESAARLVTFYYGSNSSYFRGVPRKDLRIPPTEFEAASYLSLISDLGKTQTDDRRSTVEIQLDGPVRISDGNILLVILPGVFMDDPAVCKRVLTDWKAEVRTYTMYHCNPIEYQSKLFEEVELFLKTSGTL